MEGPIWFQKYRIIQLLGRGSTSQVYLVEHINLKSYRAIKFISKKNPLYEIQRNEAFILKSLKHPCIPVIYDIEESEEGSYIIEEYFEGPNLKEYSKENSPFSEDKIRAFGIQLCQLIHYLHSAKSPILYLDIKPDNIILEKNSLKLVDFGSAKYRDELIGGSAYSGTQGYAAPELYSQNVIDERCDVYSIGMLLFNLAIKNKDKENLVEGKSLDYMDCSSKLKKIINRCIKYNPSQRYSSVNQLERELTGKSNHNQRSFHPSTYYPIKIAIAGAQHRIGTTHFAIRLCNYYIQQGRKCIYVEQNNTEVVRNIIQCYDGVFAKEGVYKLGKLPLMPRDNRWKAEELTYEIILEDLGVLTENNLEDFLKAEVQCIIVGAKDWELLQTEKILALLSEYKEVKYLFNYLDGKQFIASVKDMGKVNCYRIPYQPNPFTSIVNRQERELFREITSLIR